ncbi:MAG: hypothetical protein HY077_00690, partial [Elusimicrobia bacterium]|nr:hypothetical protein [Elusimicrobiota bacterium]
MAVPALLFASVFLGSKVLAEPPAKTPPQGARPFHSSFFGEGGSYHEPDSGAKEYLEQGPKPDPAAKRETPAAPKKTPDAFLKRDPASLRYQKGAESAREDGLPKVELPAYQAPSSSDDRRRYSLWEGIAAPLALPPEKIKDVAPDQASSLIRQDYDSHILGGPAAQAIGLSAPTRAQAAAASPETFVAIDLDLKGKELKDAVAGLSGAAGFRQDPRFEPVFSGPAREKAAV